MVERAGTPLACLVTPANAHDSRFLRLLVQRLPRRVDRLGGCKAHADKGCDQTRTRGALAEVGAIDRIARKRTDTGGLGAHRYVVGPSFSHLCGLQRCYERDPWQHLAFLQIRCILKLTHTIIKASCQDRV